jgi:hypothetical protein
MTLDTPAQPVARLIPEDHSEIAIVDGRSREVWERHARPEYWCGRCGHYHRTWSAIGRRHDPRAGSVDAR